MYIGCMYVCARMRVYILNVHTHIIRTPGSMKLYSATFSICLEVCLQPFTAVILSANLIHLNGAES